MNKWENILGGLFLITFSNLLMYIVYRIFAILHADSFMLISIATIAVIADIFIAITVIKMIKEGF